MIRPETSAPHFNTVNTLKGDVAERPSKFLAALSEADNFIAELDGLRETQTRLAELEAENAATREAFAAAVGDYSCPCGSEFWFGNDSDLEEYAALNRWLGRHVPCGAGVEAERDDLRDWRLRVADALGLAETVDGVGLVVLVNSSEEAAEYASHYTEVALTHERDCPVYCDGCEHYEMVQSCKRCNGSGCGPGTASGAYEECQWCAGDGRDHSQGYFTEACDAHADLSAERDDLAERLHHLDAAHQVTLGFLAKANAERDTWRARALAAGGAVS